MYVYRGARLDDIATNQCLNKITLEGDNVQREVDGGLRIAAMTFLHTNCRTTPPKCVCCLACENNLG